MLLAEQQYIFFFESPRLSPRKTGRLDQETLIQVFGEDMSDNDFIDCHCI